MKETWKPGTVLYPLPAVLVSCGVAPEEYNLLTVAWTGTVCTDPPMCYVSIRPERHSYGIIRRAGEFVINLTTRRLARATDWCGVRSGRDYDKFREAGPAPVPAGRGGGRPGAPRGGAPPPGGARRGADRRMEPEGDVCAVDVVIDGLGQADDPAPLRAEKRGRAVRARAAQGKQAVKTHLFIVGEHLFGAGLPVRFGDGHHLERGAHRAEHGAALPEQRVKVALL